MYKSEFSEKFFEFAVNHEVLNKIGHDIYIPSQNEEAIIGCDAVFGLMKVGIMLCQYKVVEKYFRTPAYLKKDAFKFKLHYNKVTGFNQHNTLVAFNRIPGIKAFYIVPNYNDITSFYKDFNASNIIYNISSILPSVFLKTGKSHLY